MIAPSPPGVAPSPMGASMSGLGAAELLSGLMRTSSGGGEDDSLFDLARAGFAMEDDGMGAEEEEGGGTRVSRKDKSLGLLADNFLQLFASGAASAVELESVATALGVGRRRIYDIVNVLESLDVVQKDRASAYTWLGLSKLPAAVERLVTSRPIVELLVEEGMAKAADVFAGKENGANGEASGSGAMDCDAAGKADRLEGRKEKSIRELSTKFVGLFLQAVAAPGLDGTISLEQAARSLLIHEYGTSVEPDQSAMKTKVRRLYDICNVLTSLRMIEKVKLPDTSKPAFKWLGITEETRAVFDPSEAAARPIKAYGGGVNAPISSKRGRPSLGDGRRTSFKGNEMLPLVAAPAPREAASRASFGRPTVAAQPVAAQPVATHPVAAQPVTAQALPLLPAGFTTRQPAMAVATAMPLDAAGIPTGTARVLASTVVATATGAAPVAVAAPAGAPSLFDQLQSPNAVRVPEKRQLAPAPTPAHVHDQLSGVPQLTNTPRAATAALLTLAADSRAYSNEV